jgi:hypothetical protein
MAQCAAKSKRSGEQCKANAVTGYTVCRMHGAGSPHQGRPGGGDGRPIITGRYSIKRAELARKATEFQQDSNPGDLTGELALMRALLQEYLDRFDDTARLPYDDIARIFSMTEAISRLVERIAKILTATALTQAEVQYLQARIVDLLSTYVPDPNKRAEFMDALSATIGVRGGHETAGYIDAER